MKSFVFLIAIVLILAGSAWGKTPRGPEAIDAIVLAKFKQLRITPAKICSDSVFVRRVYIDVIGTLPTAAEARAFLVNNNPRKRAKLIDYLLSRDEYADYWALKWGDLLRLKAEFPIKLWPNGVAVYHRWIHDSLKNNKPYDKFARELITSSGSNFRVGPVNFYRAVQSNDSESLARAIALTFMGVRADKWDKTRLKSLAMLFSQVGYKKTQEWKEEIIFFDSIKAARLGEQIVTLPDDRQIKISPNKDPREVFADWLITPRNPWFTKSIANRTWYWLMGRGIIHEPDDIRPENKPSNLALLTLLQRELISSRYDIKHLFRIILNSKTYQLSSIYPNNSPVARANFASYPIRRIDAEVLIDAICQITGTTESYQSPIPEPFSFIPAAHRSITLADGSITSPFLEMFGRPARDTGFELERSTDFSSAQRLHLLNSSHIQNKIRRGPKIRAVFALARRDPRQAASTLYMTILSRLPTKAEADILREYAKLPALEGTDILFDLAWALINSTEFLCKH